MRSSLNAIAGLLTGGECDARTLDWAALRYEHVAAVRAALLQRCAPATANKMLCALRRTLKEAQKLGLMAAEDCLQASSVPQIKYRASLRGRALRGAEVASLLEVCAKEGTAAGQRDAALIALLRGSGVRRSELVSLTLGDYEGEGGALKVRAGKGRKDRLIYLSVSVCSHVNRWLEWRGTRWGALLCPVHRSGAIQYRHLSDQAVLAILDKRRQQAGLEPFSPHDFRRTYISDLLEAGVDVVTVQKLAGHASPETVSAYDRRQDEALRRAAEMIRVPGSE
jgi:site-specific recombinase XerD